MWLIKKIRNLKQDKASIVDIDSQNKTWSNFKKLTIYISVSIFFILVLMAIFLL